MIIQTKKGRVRTSRDQRTSFNMAPQLCGWNAGLPERTHETLEPREILASAQFFTREPLSRGDIVIVASDGLWDNLYLDEVVTAVLPNEKEEDEPTYTMNPTTMITTLTELVRFFLVIHPVRYESICVYACYRPRIGL
jgi:serine/threonine protein phosphatase PrpC